MSVVSSFLAEGKMKPNMMIVEMPKAGQQRYLHHDDNSGCRLTPLTPVMPNGYPRSINIVEGGCCPDTKYDKKLQAKGAQHKTWSKLSRTMVTILPFAYRHRTIYVTV